MGIPIIRGPDPGPFELCHVCVMIYKGDMFKDKNMVDAVNAAIAKDSATVTIIQATIKNHWEPEAAVTNGASIFGTFGSVCWTHVAAHDDEKYQARKEEMRKEQLAQKFSVDPSKL